MDFKSLALVFENLEKTSKRLDKILILKDLANDKDFYLVFDLIAGNFQREIIKKNLGISLKTIFSVLEFVSKKNISLIEKEFNKIGDIGKLAQNLFNSNNQFSFNKQILDLNSIFKVLGDISKTSGTNSNKRKKELLSNLFLNANSALEYRYLARLLIADLRIGVSKGVLKESFTNIIFPPILGIHYLDDLKINFLSQLSLKEQKMFLEINNSKEITEINLEDLIFKKDFIKYEDPRKIYNLMLDSIERKYNCLNSFKDLYFELRKDKTNILKSNIILGKPILSMLGTRVKTIEESFKTTGTPSYFDYKYDGLRTQIHNDYGNVKIFSRNLDDITEQFPDIIKYVKENFSHTSFVLDSETVGYNYVLNEFLPFQKLSKRILSKNFEDVKDINISVKVFDILYLNGESLLNTPFNVRRVILEKLFLNIKLSQKNYGSINSK